MNDVIVPVRLFVYGTLKLRHHNNHYLGDSKFLSDGVTKLKYPLVRHGIPFLYNEPGVGHHVKGEVFDVLDQDVLANIDRLEGHPRWYKRETVEIVRPRRHSGVGPTSWFCLAYFCQEKRDASQPLIEEYLKG